MLSLIPFHYVIPALVFLSIILITLLVGLYTGKRREPLVDEMRFGKEPKLNYVIPENYPSLDPASKRRVTIHNLYLNHGETPEDIAILLEIEPAFVVDVLKKSGHASSLGGSLQI